VIPKKTYLKNKGFSSVEKEGMTMQTR